MANWQSALIFNLLIIGATIQITTSNVISTSMNKNGETNGGISRIVGGVVAQSGEFKGIVSIQTIFIGHFCIGTIVALDAVVTAAHCLISDGELAMPIEDIVIIGDDLNMFPSANRQQRFVIDVTPHPDYNANTNANDVAVILLSQPFVSTATFDIVVMPFSKPTDNTQCSVAGWGYTNYGTQYFSETLLKADINIINIETCNSTHRYSVPINTICAGDMINGKGYCQGDTGTSLICGNRFVGIASYIENCGIPGNPGIYTDVSIFRIWIYQIIARGPATTTTTATTITSSISDTSDPPIVTTTEWSSITTPPDISITTPPEISITTPPEISITTPPEISITTPPEISITTTPEISITTPPEISITTPPEISITTPIFESSSIITTTESSAITTITESSTINTPTVTTSSPITTISPVPIITTVDPNHATSFTTSFLVVVLLATLAQYI